MEDKGCRLIVPDGSLEKVVHQLLADAGIPISYPDGARSYRGSIGNRRLFPPPFDVAVKMRPWDAPWVIADRRADLAFTGQDLVLEAGCRGKVVELDTYPLSRGGRGKTELVIAVPKDSAIKGVKDITAEHELVTEYPRLARRYCRQYGIRPRVRVCHGSLEAFGGIADVILENVETGLSLLVNGWRVVERVMEVQTCLIAHQIALKNSFQLAIIDEVRLLLNSVISGRKKRLIKCNVTPGVSINMILAILPAAQVPTRSDLADDRGFALESVVDESQVESLLPQLKAAGATAIVVAPIAQYVL